MFSRKPSRRSRKRTSAASRRRSKLRGAKRPLRYEPLEDRLVLATLFWQGDDSSNWSEAGNWNTAQDGSGADQAPVSNDTLNFDSTTTGLTSFTANNDINGLTGITIAISDTDGTNDFVLGGTESVGLAAAGITASGANGTVGVGFPISLAAGTAFANNGTRLIISSDIDNGGNLLTSTASTQTITYDGVISGAGGFTSAGGVNELTKANTYAGLTTLSSGEIRVSGAGRLGNTAAGTTIALGELVLNNNNYTAAEQVNLNGGTIASLTADSTFAGDIVLGANSGLRGYGDAELQLDGVVSGGFGLNVLAGDVNLAGANTYTGNTTIDTGTLLVTGSTAAASTITVNNGATLAGDGDVNGPVNVLGGGTIAPGLSPGIIMTGDLNLASGSTLEQEINAPGATAGTDYDQIQVTGTVTIGDVTFDLSGDEIPLNGDEFIIIDNDGADAVNLAAGAPAQGSIVGQLGERDLRIRYNAGSGNDVALYAQILTPIISANSSGDPGINSGDGIADNFVVRLNGPNVEVSVNGDIVFNESVTSVGSIGIKGSSDDDTLTIDTSGGLILPEITYDGDGNRLQVGDAGFPSGDGFDTLLVQGSVGANTVEITQGQNASEGNAVYDSGAMTIHYMGLEPFVDVIASPSLTINGTNADNAINYMAGPNSGAANAMNPAGDLTGLVSVDDFESYEFANKVALTINAQAGDDVVNLNNPVVPTGLATITVNGDDPTASDKLIVNAFGANGNDVAVGEFELGGATITGDGLDEDGGAAIAITANTIESLVVNGGNSPDIDLQIVGVAGNSEHFTHTPGASFDSGSVIVSDIVDGGGNNGGTLLEVSYQNLGGSEVAGAVGSLTIDGNGNVSAADRVSLLGTSANDTFGVSFSALDEGRIDLSGPTGNHIPLFTSDLRSIFIDSLSGDDAFNVQGGVQLTTVLGGGLRIAGGDNGDGSDVLNFVAGASVNVDLEDLTILEAGFAPVFLSGIETANLNANTVAVSFDGTAGDDTITYSPETLASGTVELEGLATVFNVSNVDNLDIDGLTGADQLIVEGTAADDLIVATATTIDIDTLLPVDYSNFAAATINGASGDDTLFVNNTPGLVETPIAFDGGIGNDQLLLNGTTAITTSEYTPGLTVDAGTVVHTDAVGAQQVVHFVGIEPLLDLVPAVTLTVNGTNADNAINYSPGNVNAANNGLVSIDGFESIEFTAKQNLVINALAGDDVVNLNNLNTPVNLAGISVNAGDPTASDKVIVNGTGGLNAITVTTIDVDGAVVTGAQPVPVVVDMAELLVIDGQGGNDTLSLTIDSGDEVDLLPGESADSGSLRIADNVAGAAQGRLPIDYQGLGLGGSLTLASTAGVRDLNLRLHGTDEDDRFETDNLGQLQVQTGGAPSAVTLPINTAGVNSVAMLGFDGDDVFDIVGNHPFAGGIDLQGGAPDSGSDVLNFTGAGLVVGLSLELETVRESVFGPVHYGGIETLNLDTNGEFRVTGTADNDVYDVTPLDDGVAAFDEDGRFVHNFSEGIDFNYIDASSIDFDGGSAGFDTLNVYGDDGADVITSTATEVVVDGSGVRFQAATIESLGIYALGGDDDIQLDILGTETLLDAGDGDDTVDLDGFTANATVIAGAGDDTVDAEGVANDAVRLTLMGGDGNDNLIGGDSPTGSALGDILDGGAGDDRLEGGRGQDIFFGGDGSDQLVWIGGDGSDLMEGGDGVDSMFFDAGNGNNRMELFGGGIFGATVNPAPNIFGPGTLENSGRAIFALNSAAQDNAAVFLNMADVEVIDVQALAGADEMILNNQRDTLSAIGSVIQRGTELAATSVRGVEVDLGVADAAVDNLEVHGTLTADTIDITSTAAGRIDVAGLSYSLIATSVEADDEFFAHGEDGDDTIKAAVGVEAIVGITLNGNAGDDFLSADAVINGGAGDDTLVGGLGVDTISGNDGNDTIFVSPGNDNIDGGAGDDVLKIVTDFGPNTVSIAETAANMLTSNIDGVASTDTFANLELLRVELGDGNDELIVELQNNLLISLPIFYDGGTGSDLLTVQGQLAAGPIDSVNYTPGIQPDEGRLLYNDAGNVMDISFDNLEPVVDNSVAVNLTVNGTPAANSITYSAASANTGLVEIDNFETMQFSNKTNLILDAGSGPDVIDLNPNGNQPTGLQTITVEAGEGDDVVTLANITNQNNGVAFTSVAVNGAGGDDYIDGSLVAAITLNLSGGLGDDTLVGGGGNDNLSGGLGEDSLDGGAGNDNLDGGAGNDYLVGGAGNNTYTEPAIVGDFDTIGILGTPAGDAISVNQTSATTLASTLNGDARNDTIALAGSVERVEVLAENGDDTIVVTWADALGVDGADNALLMEVDGGPGFTNDRLGVLDDGTGDLVMLQKGEADSTGKVTIGPGNNEPLVANFQNIEFIQPVAAAGGQVEVIKHDPFEFNDAQNIATHLGAGEVINVDPSIDPPIGLLGLPADQDFYRLEALETGTLDFQVFFNQVPTVPSGRPGLPGNGDLDIEVLDEAGNVIVGFGANDADSDERVRIPAVQGQLYFLRVFGANGNAINNYSITVINDPAPVPYDLELDDAIAYATAGNVVAGIANNMFQGNAGLSAVDDFYNGQSLVFTSGPLVNQSVYVSDYVGATRTFTVAPAFSAIPVAGDTFELGLIESDDTGRSQFDNVTRDVSPNIFLRLDDDILLEDLPGNPTPDTPVDEVIAIPFNPSINPADTTPGYRVAIFIEGDPQQPGQDPQVLVGFATKSVVVDGVYEFDFDNAFNGAGLALTDGSHFISAKVQFIDPANPTQTGFGQRSVSLEIVVDAITPPVTFGSPTSVIDGLDPAETDSGVPGYPATFVDRITNATTAGFWGTAEANSVVRVYADLNFNNMVDADDVLLGLTVADPADGTNQFPSGQWDVTTNIDLNDPSYFPQDGLRRLLVTGEDLAGNESEPDILDIFVDTRGPQVDDVYVTGFQATYDLFAPKPLTQGPTPRVDSLSIDVVDLPERIAAFLYDALHQEVAEESAHYTLIGDEVGPIAIQQVNVVQVSNPGAAATATIELVFFEPLPDDRFTLTISDSLVDPANNALDGESGLIGPIGVPDFPTGDGVPGGDFVGRFTIDSRAEIATWSSGSVFVDINQNYVFDPEGPNTDETNRDLVFTFGDLSSAIFAGDFAPAGAGASSGYDKLGAYGFDNDTGLYRFLLDFDHDGLFDFTSTSAFQINAYPVAGDFDPTHPGDEIGLFDGTTWYLDTDGDNVLELTDTIITNGQVGLPIVGDFNGDGNDDLGTFDQGSNLFTFDMAFNGFGAIDDSFTFGFNGYRDRPVAGDLNLDGIDDIGLFVPRGDVQISEEVAEWYFIVSDNTGFNLPSQAFDMNALPNNADFVPDPLGNDIFAQFGNQFALPLMGNFDPPVVSSVDVTDYSLMQNQDNMYDVNNDGVVTPIDALTVINAMDAEDFDAFMAGDGQSMYVDVNGDGDVTPIDALNVINMLDSQEASGSAASGASGGAMAAAVSASSEGGFASKSMSANDAGAMNSSETAASFAGKQAAFDVDQLFTPARRAFGANGIVDSSASNANHESQSRDEASNFLVETLVFANSTEDSFSTRSALSHSANRGVRIDEMDDLLFSTPESEFSSEIEESLAEIASEVSHKWREG